MTTHPRIRFFAVIVDVGERGGDVAVTWSADPDASGNYTAKDIREAGKMAGELWARLMYGADEPGPKEEVTEP